MPNNNSLADQIFDAPIDATIDEAASTSEPADDAVEPETTDVVVP